MEKYSAIHPIQLLTSEWLLVVCGFLAAIATVWAVVVALRTTQRSIDAAERLRQLDHEQQEQVRRRKQKALAAALSDDFFQVLGVLQYGIRRLEDFKIEMSSPRMRKIDGRIARLNPPTFSVALGQLEVFEEDFAKMLAPRLVSFSHMRAIAEHDVENLRTSTRFFSEPERMKIARKFKKEFNWLLAVRNRALDVAGIDPASRAKLEAYEIEETEPT